MLLEVTTTYKDMFRLIFSFKFFPGELVGKFCKLENGVCLKSNVLKGFNLDYLPIFCIH